MAGPWEKYADKSQSPWDKYGQTTDVPAGQSQYAAGSIAPPLTSHAAATEYGLKELGGGIADVGRGMLQTVTKPPEGTAETIANTLGPGALPIYRMGKSVVDLGKQALQVPSAIRDLSESPDPMGTLALVAPRAAGQAVANIAPAIAPTVLPPIIRTAAKGTNAVLERAPGVLGAGIGTAIGQELGHPYYGGAAGYAIGRDLFPKLRIPGEEFGLSPEEVAMRHIGPDTKAAIKEGTAIKIPTRLTSSQTAIPPEPQAAALGRNPNVGPISGNLADIPVRDPFATVDPLRSKLTTVPSESLAMGEIPATELPQAEVLGRIGQPAGEVQAARRFMTENPSALGTIGEKTAPGAAGSIVEGIKGSLPKGAGRLVETPEELQQLKQLYQIAKRDAHERGMAFAGGQVPAGGRKVPYVPRPNITEEWSGKKD